MQCHECYNENIPNNCELKKDNRYLCGYRPMGGGGGEGAACKLISRISLCIAAVWLVTVPARHGSHV